MSFFEAPPEALMIEGKEYPVETDFRTWIRFQNIITKNNTDDEKAAEIVSFIAKQGLPFSESTLKEIIKFFSGGDNSKGGESKPSYDFDTDGNLIFSAFMTQYKIDLTVEKMHWWKFKAMFSSLSDEHMISKIMWARSADTKDMSKEMKKYAEKLKTAYPLKIEKKMTAAEHHRSMIDYVERRRKEVQKKAEK